MSVQQETDLKMMEILRILYSKNEILGAKVISEELKKRGYSLGERAVRYHMRILDEKGFTRKIGHKGREITNKGIEELNEGLIYDQVDFSNSLFQEKMYNVTLDTSTGKGSVIVNISSINDNNAIALLKKVFEEGLAVSKNINMFEKEEKTFIQNVCGTTIDGVFRKNGIISRPLYGGLVKIEDYVPIKFVNQISYEKTSITPLEAFTGKSNTSILDVMNSGTGIIPANFRIIPATKEKEANLLLNNLKKIGINGLIQMGKPNESILGVPAYEDMIGIAIIGGVTPLCAAQEDGYNLDIKVADDYAEYQSMKTMNYRSDSIFKPSHLETTDRISFILTKIYNLISNVTFNPQTFTGNVIANVSYVDKQYVDECIELLNKIYKLNPEYYIGNKYTILDGDNSDKVGIATMCSLTINGILTNSGIYSSPEYGGILKFEEDNRRFTELISYKGSSVDPHEIFIKKHLIDLSTNSSSSKILASVHSVPYVSRDDALDILSLMDDSSFNILTIGEPNQYIYNAKINMYNFGYAVPGGLNLIAAINENDIPVDIRPIEKILDYNNFETL